MARRRLEAEAGVVTRTPLEHDERFADGIGERGDGGDEQPADTLAVVSRIDGQRREHDDRDRGAVIAEVATTDHHMPDDRAVERRHQRQLGDVSRGRPDGFDESCLGRRAERGSDHLGNLVVIAR